MTAITVNYPNGSMTVNLDAIMTSTPKLRKVIKLADESTLHNMMQCYEQICGDALQNGDIDTATCANSAYLLCGGAKSLLDGSPAVKHAEIRARLEKQLGKTRVNRIYSDRSREGIGSCGGYAVLGDSYYITVRFDVPFTPEESELVNKWADNLGAARIKKMMDGKKLDDFLSNYIRSDVSYTRIDDISALRQKNAYLHINKHGRALNGELIKLATDKETVKNCKLFIADRTSEKPICDVILGAKSISLICELREKGEKPYNDCTVYTPDSTFTPELDDGITINPKTIIPKEENTMKAQEYKAKAQAKAAQKKAPKVDPIAQENEQLKKQLAEMKAQIAALMAAQVQPTPEETAPEEAPKNPAPERPEYVKGDWNFKLYGNGQTVYVNGEKLEISFEQKQELNEYKRQLAEYIKNDTTAPEVLSGHDWNLVTYNYGRTIYLDGKKTAISKEQHEDIKKYMEMIA